ncbi:D-2-hydroxyacid dehydrogenase [Pelagicoccus mobilis]|uniref:D-2-hydroxyacid dehydrogenase n=1 Tax=Pelagicoccus mobilis TaxID=415221 RepID=A0A934S3T5_9BACT|nr:D-2-hydroxyacid dehydrogenase [Pelagicoccus mobilis]MBK1879267.1 D-2-hydroxyacid dehydrogenase [Pelagicoccus mobilis]
MSLKIYVDFALTPELLERLKAGTQGHELILPKKPASVLSLGEIEPSFYEADIAFGQPITEAIEKAESLKWIQVSSSGVTRYDTPEFRSFASSKGIKLSNSASVFNDACADHTLSFMLAQSRKLPQGLASTTANGTDEWNQLRSGSVSLRGQSAIILGYGAIGKRLAELLAPFEMKLSAYRRTPRGDEGMPVIDAESLPAALAETDHIINILPDSQATQQFFDATRFAQCKPGSVFYNIGRGTTVDQSALAQALSDGPIREAWLDVTDPEPLPADHQLRQLPNCFITPHTAGGHANEAESCIDHFLRNLQLFTDGKEPNDRVI